MSINTIKNNTLDQIILVNSDDQQIGIMDKVEAHRYPVKLHRASSVYLFRKNKNKIELLIQQRSQKKIVGAMQWANTVCVNLRPQETYLSAAKRRLNEELGIQQAVIEEIYIFSYQLSCNEEFGENEIDHVFAGWYDGEIDLNLDEAARVKWVDFLNLKNEESLDFAPWFELMLNDQQLTINLNNYLKK